MSSVGSVCSLFVVKAIAIKQQLPQIQLTEASNHIYQTLACHKCTRYRFYAICGVSHGAKGLTPTKYNNSNEFLLLIK